MDKQNNQESAAWRTYHIENHTFIFVSKIEEFINTNFYNIWYDIMGNFLRK